MDLARANDSNVRNQILGGQHKGGTINDTRAGPKRGNLTSWDNITCTVYDEGNRLGYEKAILLLM
jgi:hypothetical protein